MLPTSALGDGQSQIRILSWHLDWPIKLQGFSAHPSGQASYSWSFGLLSGLLPNPPLKTIGKRWQSRSAADILTLKTGSFDRNFDGSVKAKMHQGEIFTGYPRTRVHLVVCEPTFPPDADRGTAVLYESTGDSIGRVRPFPGFAFSTVCGFQQDVVLMSQHTKVWQEKKAVVPREWSWWMKPGKSAIWLKTSVESVHIRGYYMMVRCDSLTWYLLRSLRNLWAGPLWRQTQSYRKYKSLPVLNDNYVFNQEL